MAKFGKIPVEIPEPVEVDVEEGLIRVKGPKGQLVRRIPRNIVIEKQDGVLVVDKKVDSKETKALRGTTRAHLVNMIKGVSVGWIKQLEVVGAGFRAETQGNKLVLNVGFSHPVEIEAPEGITFKVEKSLISVEGIDRELVGQIAARIRGVKKPEPYKGVGIRYKDEVIRRKAGKQAAKVGE